MRNPINLIIDAHGALRNSAKLFRIRVPSRLTNKRKRLRRKSKASLVSQSSSVTFAEGDRPVRRDTLISHDQEEQTETLGRIIQHIEFMARVNDANASAEKRISLSLNLQIFIERLVNQANMCLEEDVGIESIGVRCAILAVEYLHRSHARVTFSNATRFFAVAFLVAFKYTEDIPVSNYYWARVCGYSLYELNQMETALIENMDWRVEVTGEVFAELFRHFAMDEGRSEARTRDESLDATIIWDSVDQDTEMMNTVVLA